MPKKTIYTVGKLDLNLKSETRTITISNGDIVEFEPETTAKNLKSEVFNVCLTRGVNKSYFKSKGTIVKRIIENSTKKVINQTEELFELDPNQEKYNELVGILHAKQEELLKLLKKVDLAANSNEIVPTVQSLVKNLKLLSGEIDFSNLTKPQEKALNQLENVAFELSCSNKNIVSQEKPYKYLKQLEKFALQNLEDAMGWLKNDRDIYMNHATLNDFLDIINISTLLNKGNLKQCYEKMSDLDTYVREGIPLDLWNEWVLEVQFKSSDITEQKEQYQIIINNADNKPVKKVQFK